MVSSAHLMERLGSSVLDQTVQRHLVLGHDVVMTALARRSLKSMLRYALPVESA